MLKCMITRQKDANALREFDENITITYIILAKVEEF